MENSRYTKWTHRFRGTKYRSFWHWNAFYGEWFLVICSVVFRNICRTENQISYWIVLLSLNDIFIVLNCMVYRINVPKSQSLIWMLSVTNLNFSAPFAYLSTSTLTSLINQFSKEMSKWHTFFEWIYSMQSIICFRITFATFCHSAMSMLPSTTYSECLLYV